MIIHYQWKNACIKVYLLSLIYFSVLILKYLCRLKTRNPRRRDAGSSDSTILCFLCTALFFKLFCWEKVAAGLCAQQHVGRSDHPPLGMMLMAGLAGAQLEVSLEVSVSLPSSRAGADTEGCDASCSALQRCCWPCKLEKVHLGDAVSGPNSSAFILGVWWWPLLCLGLSAPACRGQFPPEALGRSFSHTSVLQLLVCLGIALEGAW